MGRLTMAYLTGDPEGGYKREPPMAQTEIEILREQVRQLWGAVTSLQDQLRRLTEGPAK